MWWVYEGSVVVVRMSVFEREERTGWDREGWFASLGGIWIACKELGGLGITERELGCVAWVELCHKVQVSSKMIVLYFRVSRLLVHYRILYLY